MRRIAFLFVALLLTTAPARAQIAPDDGSDNGSDGMRAAVAVPQEAEAPRSIVLKAPAETPTPALQSRADVDRALRTAATSTPAVPSPAPVEMSRRTWLYVAGGAVLVAGGVLAAVLLTDGGDDGGGSAVAGPPGRPPSP